MAEVVVLWTLWPGGPLLDTSAQIDDPWVRRALGIASWGDRLAVVNTGNELQFLDLQTMRLGASTSWRVPPFGDRDYNLFNFSLCDDCTIGVAGFQSVGSVLFTAVRTPTTASWGAHRRYPDARIYGGATYLHGGVQYLAAGGLTDACHGGGTVYRPTGLEPGDLHAVGCVLAGASEISVDGGLYLDGYLWVVSGTRVHRYRVEADGTVTWLGELTRAGFVRGAGIALDQEAHLLAAATPYGAELWSVADPEAPVRLAQWQPHQTIDPDTVALRYPYLWCAAYGGTTELMTHTFDVSDPAHPVEVAEETWANGAPAQQYAHAGNMAALFLPDYRLLVARWSVLLLLEPEWAPPPAEVFADGFETGTTGAWSVQS